MSSLTHADLKRMWKRVVNEEGLTREECGDLLLEITRLRQGLSDIELAAEGLLRTSENQK